MIKSKIGIIAGIVLGFILLMCSTMLIENQDASDILVIQSLTGAFALSHPEQKEYCACLGYTDTLPKPCQ